MTKRARPLGLHSLRQMREAVRRVGADVEDSCRLGEPQAMAGCQGGLEPPRYCFRQRLKIEDVVNDDGRPLKIGVGCHASWPTKAHEGRASWRRLQILAKRTSRA